MESILAAFWVTIKLTVYSENDPNRGDTRAVDPKVLEQITQDFATL